MSHAICMHVAVRVCTPVHSLYHAASAYIAYFLTSIIDLILFCLTQNDISYKFNNRLLWNLVASEATKDKSFNDFLKM